VRGFVFWNPNNDAKLYPPHFSQWASLMRWSDVTSFSSGIDTKNLFRVGMRENWPV
jgi:hypothetical protein